MSFSLKLSSTPPLQADGSITFTASIAQTMTIELEDDVPIGTTVTWTINQNGTQVSQAVGAAANITGNTQQITATAMVQCQPGDVIAIVPTHSP